MGEWERKIPKSIGAYSDSEVNTKKQWIDGKPIYRKVIDVGALPNNTSKNTAHNISSFDNIISITGYAENGTQWTPLPHASDANNTLTVYAGATNVTVVTYADKTSYNGIVVLEYTK